MELAVRTLELPDILILTPKRYVDERGFFSETFNKSAFAEAGVDQDFLQDNHSLSIHTGTVRGLHFQLPPFAQAKLVRVVRGRILDVAVDIRQNSPTFGRHVAAEISADQGNQIFVPVGFAHGFCTLEPNTEVAYKVTNYYSAKHDFGIRWNDPQIGIHWPVRESDARLSQKDQTLPFLVDAEFF